MRWIAAGALLCGLAPATAAAQSRPHALIAFLPAGPRTDAGLLRAFAARGMAIGMTSPTVGGFKPRQMALDITQGSRIPIRLYSKRIGSLRLRRTAAGEWELLGWNIAARRARDAPGDLVPGLLASTAKSARRTVGYAGVRAGPHLAAVVAADEGGHLPSVSVGPARTLVTRALAAWRRLDLLAVDLPRGGRGLRALDSLLAVRGGAGLVYVVHAPAGRKLRLLASGLLAPGVRGRLRSATTRQTGLIAATDIAPTVLHALGVAVPDSMQGQIAGGRGTVDVGAVQSLADRLQVVASRRGTCLLAFAAGWLLLLALLAGIARGRGVRMALRAALLAGLWVPGLALLNAALAPGRATEALILAGGSLLLGLGTDRLVRWPAAPAVPAAIVFLAHAVDLARGSPLIARSIAGPNPAGGARFYGIGNELEVILSVSVLIGAGAALALLRPVGAGRVAFAAVAVVAALILGAGRLGADVGAVITLAAGGAAAAIASSGRPLSRRALALAVAAPVAAVLALIVVDLITGGNAHLTRSVVHAHGSEGLTDVFTRRLRAAAAPLQRPGPALVFVAALAGVAWLAARRQSVLGALASVRGGDQVRAGIIGAFFAVAAGTLANDSGPLILEIGAALLALTALYAAAPPEQA